MLSKFSTSINDPRNLQIAVLSTFIIYGVIWLNWSVHLFQWSLVVASAIMTQAVGYFLLNEKKRSYQSALITALGLCLLLHTASWWAGVLAALLSILVKFLIRVDGKHFFNPSNFGIVVTILLTGEAWISPGQWGSGAFLIFLIGGAALLVTVKVKRLSAGITFLAVLFILEYLRTVVYLGWGTDVLLHKFSSGSILLFAFFMITDPVTTPSATVPRLVWAGAVAGLAFALTNWFYLYTAPLYALFVLAPLTPLINRMFPAARFQWSAQQKSINPKLQLS
jgi:Na+-transporting NADH:ubiquinone oxidoreductase subunit NqrB